MTKKKTKTYVTKSGWNKYRERYDDNGKVIEVESFKSTNRKWFGLGELDDYEKIGDEWYYHGFINDYNTDGKKIKRFKKRLLSNGSLVKTKKMKNGLTRLYFTQKWYNKNE